MKRDKQQTLYIAFTILAVFGFLFFNYVVISQMRQDLYGNNRCEELGFDGYKPNELVKKGNIVCYLFLEDNVTKQYVAVAIEDKQ